MKTTLLTPRPDQGDGVPAATDARRLRDRRYRRRAATADVLAVATWTSAAAAVSLYLASSGLASFGTTAGIVTGLGVIAGLVGTDLVLVMLLLAARIPLIDRTFGQDHAIAVHRSLGKPALYLLLAHGALLSVGYGLSAGLDPVRQTISLFSTVADMPLAYLGLALLVTVVVSSLVAVRRRLSYEAWHLIHLLSYAAVLVALPHQLSQGGMLAEGSWQRVYWIALYTAALGAIVIYRFALPTLRTIFHGLRVDSVETIARGVFSIRLTGRHLDRLGVAGGQYAIWRFWSAGTWWHAHPVSFSAMPTSREMRITVRELGKGTSSLTRLPAGTRVSIEGPYGVFTDEARAAPHLAIIVAGIGITPARALLEGSPLKPGEATMLVRAAAEDERYLWGEIGDLASSTGSTLYSMVGPRPRGVATWMSAEDAARGVTITSVFPRLVQSDLYVCGPPAWADLVLRDALAAGIAPHRVHIERFEP